MTFRSNAASALALDARSYDARIFRALNAALEFRNASSPTVLISCVRITPGAMKNDPPYVMRGSRGSNKEEDS